ncbi:MAG: aminotransferase class III-fold pyridoxal phosphate-dependent enzyme [Anaerolineae bacterium]|nr:aminotransferase class III-fold pyridoxal phosphate-dependent enzyme [Anaerolineae bacterium]NUQ03819.1 aminotransferase class III-fold pyridoxal phosphate-dependent enzyme [Anaerolineae bacterium]
MQPALDHLSPAWSHLTTVQPVRGEGIYLYDADNTRYIDFTSGIGVTNTGHCHPRVVAAIQKQAANLIHGQINIVVSPAAIELSRRLNEVTPDGIDCFFFSNSGAEATEGAVKLARQATGRQNIIVFQGSFHGRTAQTMAMTTSKTVYRAGYQPLPGGIFVAPFPYSYRHGWDEETTVDWCIEQLETLLKSQTAPSETAAIVIEPVLGEGGYVPAPDRFLRALRDICTRDGILLVIDEVQTGFGRTGAFFAVEHSAVQPDIMIMAKGLGSGVPISAIGASRDLMAKWQPGAHGGTYGGNALAAAAAVATIAVMREENLPANAARVGDRLMHGLKELQAEYPIIGDVRGRGLMIGMEFGPSAKPDKTAAKKTQQGSVSRNLLLLTCGTHDNVIRWIPPLVVTDEQVDTALSIFAEALADASY